MLTLLLLLTPASPPALREPPAFNEPPDFRDSPAFNDEAVSEEEDDHGYTACLRAVDAGRTVYLAVGAYINVHEGDYWTRRLDGVGHGRYRCWLDKVKGRQMQLVDENNEPMPLRTAPAVTPTPTVSGLCSPSE